MITKDRRLLEQIIKQWAQEHDVNYIIADYTPSAAALKSTQAHLTWVIQNGALLDLVSLADQMEDFLDSRRKRPSPDGLVCGKCQTFYEFAEPNQEDGSMICYSCRHYYPYK